MEFGKLRSMIEDSRWQSAVDELMELKKANDEKALITAVPLLQQWIAETLLKITEGASAFRDVRHDTEALDNIFRKYIHSPIAG